MIQDAACKVGMHLKHEYDIFYALMLRNLDQADCEQRVRNLLAALIRHAHSSNSDYYRKIIDSSAVDAEQFEVEDLAKLPILTKDDIRMNFGSHAIEGLSGPTTV